MKRICLPLALSNLKVKAMLYMPEHATLDNCTSKGQDFTVEYRETETIPTDHLNTKGLSLEQMLALFTTDLVLVTQPHLEEEFKHLWKTLVPLVCPRLQLVLEEADRSIHDARCAIRCLVKNVS